MRFNIKCNECDRTFIAETEFYGLQRYRCPYCGHVLTCQFNAPEAKRTKARAVVPMANTTPVERHSKKELPTVKTKLIRMPSAEKIAELRKKIAETSRQASEKVKEGTIKTSEYLSRSSSWLAQFQEKYTDGNLWVFFGFSTLLYCRL